MRNSPGSWQDRAARTHIPLLSRRTRCAFAQYADASSCLRFHPCCGRAPGRFQFFGPSSSRPSRKVWVPDLIDNTFGSTPPALRRGYASRVNVPVAFECQVRSGLPTVLVHFRLWRFRTRLWRIITRRRWESRTYKARSAGRPSAENSCTRSRL